MKIGLLPLYIKLYGDNLHYRLEPFYTKVTETLEKRGLQVVTSPFCCLKEEFEEIIKRYETENVDCIVTLHMAYSPSLESAEVLSKTSLPIVVLDTTETFDFSPMQNPDEISFCHGIHGVMDMCNLLKRNCKDYAICAGHFENSDVIDRCIGFVKAAVAANALRDSKTGSVGGSFDGMGDFLVSDEEMKRTFGVEVVYSKGEELAAEISSVTNEEIAAEMELDRKMFEGEADVDVHKESTRVCLGLRKWAEKNSLSAFTVNFLHIGPESGITIMPFMEASKAMARGIGYAGEGDALTASFVGALMKSFNDTSFIEIFCPDWKSNTLFISHMGEMNIGISAGKCEYKETPVAYGNPSGNPVVAYGCFKSGKAVFANVYRDAEGFKLLISPVQMTAPDEDNFKGNVRGWMKPEMPITDFLEKISIEGVTHHSMLVYDATPEQIDFFGRLLGLRVVRV